VLRVAAAAIVREGCLLLVSKNAAPHVFYLPGGKPDPGEAIEDCVRRELREELGVEALSLEFHQTVHAPAALEGIPMSMDVFRCVPDREPVASAEIAALAWYDPDQPFAGTLAPAIHAIDFR
jgi:8-oxo-dGTP diphosphatase